MVIEFTVCKGGIWVIKPLSLVMMFPDGVNILRPVEYTYQCLRADQKPLCSSQAAEASFVTMPRAEYGVSPC